MKKAHPMDAAQVEARKLRDGTFVAFLRSQGIPSPVTEWHFAAEETPPRDWRFDFAWMMEPTKEKVAVEVEGGIWTKGAHTRGKHWLSDAVKYNTAAILGWKVLRITPEQMLHMDTVALIRRALAL